MDEADKQFKWVCGKCGACFEESDLGMLEVRQQTHKCEDSKVMKSKPQEVKCNT